MGIDIDQLQLVLYSFTLYNFVSLLLLLQTIQAVQPDIVLLELCRGRLSILELDEETLLEEAKNFNMAKFRQSIKQVSSIILDIKLFIIHC